MIKYAAVMAGGQSRRFGRDKTLEMFRGRRLVEHGVDALRYTAENIIVVAKDCDKYRFLDVDCVADEYDVQCPMVGILTALKYFNGDVFIVAADTPLVMGKHAERLMQAMQGHDAAVPLIYGKHHPLYACYSSRMIAVFEKSLASGQYALMKCLMNADTVFPDENVLLDTPEEAAAFTNINTEDDMTGAPSAPEQLG